MKIKQVRNTRFLVVDEKERLQNRLAELLVTLYGKDGERFRVTFHPTFLKITTEYEVTE